MQPIENLLCCDQLVLNQSLKTVEYRGKALYLSPTSFDLLFHLMRQAPSVVSVDELLKLVWVDKVVNRETVKQQIKTLRDQLGEAAVLVESVRGFGYQIKSSEVGLAKLKQHGKKRRYIIKNVWMLLPILLIIFSLNGYLNLGSRLNLSLPLKTATLPFKLLDSDDQDLVLLLQDELTSMMSKQEDVKAISVSALEHAEYKNYSLQEYADMLNVDVLFEGSIQEQHTGYQVNVRMVWTQTSMAVWRESLNIEEKNRELLLAKTSDSLQSFIQKKVAHIKSKSS